MREVWSDDESLRPPVARIAAGEFSASVVTWATGRSAMLAFLARVPRRVGQARRLYSPLFTDRVVVRSELGDHRTHWTQILLDYARPLGCDVADATPRFAIDARMMADARRLRVEREIPSAYVLLHPTRGIAAARERWPTAGFVALARALEATFDARVVVSGSLADAAIADEIAARTPCLSIAGQTTIGELAALARGALRQVRRRDGQWPDASRRRRRRAATVGIFALQSDEPDRWAPLGPRTAVVRASYPCPLGHRKETCPDFACVARLDVDAIVRAASGLVRG